MSAPVATLDEAIERVAWSTDGRLLATADLGGHVAVVAPDGEGTSWRRSAHAGGVLTLAWQPRAPVLATGGEDEVVVVHDATTGTETARIDAGGRVHALTWTPRGDRFAIAAGVAVLVADAAGVHRAAFPLLAGTVHALAWVDGPTPLAAGTRGGIAWLAPDGGASEPALIEPVRGAAIGLAPAPEGRRLAVADLAGGLHLTDHRAGDEAHVTGWDHIDGMAWDASGRRLAVAEGADLTVWHLTGTHFDDGEPVHLHGHSAAVTGLQYRGDTLATCDEDGLVLRWPLDRLHDPLVERLDAPVRALAWRPGGTSLAVGTADGRVVLVR